LRIAQTLAYILAVAVGFTTFFPPVRQALSLPNDPSTAEYVLLCLTFAFLVLSIFAIKPFLYDVFVNIRGNEISFLGGGPVFRESLIAANLGNLPEVI